MTAPADEFMRVIVESVEKSFDECRYRGLQAVFLNMVMGEMSNKKNDTWTSRSNISKSGSPEEADCFIDTWVKHAAEMIAGLDRSPRHTLWKDPANR